MVLNTNHLLGKKQRWREVVSPSSYLLFDIISSTFNNTVDKIVYFFVSVGGQQSIISRIFNLALLPLFGVTKTINRCDTLFLLPFLYMTLCEGNQPNICC